MEFIVRVAAVHGHMRDRDATSQASSSRSPAPTGGRKSFFPGKHGQMVMFFGKIKGQRKKQMIVELV